MPAIVVFKAHDRQSFVAAIFVMTSRYIHVSSAQPLHSVIRETDHKKLLLKALPLALLFLSAAIHACCACPMEFHDEEGPGSAERACLRTAKRKRDRGRIASHTELVILTPLIVQSTPF